MLRAETSSWRNPQKNISFIIFEKFLKRTTGFEKVLIDTLNSRAGLVDLLLFYFLFRLRIKKAATRVS